MAARLEHGDRLDFLARSLGLTRAPGEDDGALRHRILNALRPLLDSR